MESSLNKKQKSSLAQFMEFTWTKNKNQAIEILKDCNWNVDQAVEVFYSNYAGMEPVEEAPPKASKSKGGDFTAIDSVFNKYAKGEREITEEGINEFFQDLGIDAMDPVTLVISFNMGASVMGEYSKTEFRNGFQAMDCTSVSDLKRKIPTLRKSLKNEKDFGDVYKFVFNFLKGEDARNVIIDYAIPMWELLLKEYYGSKIESFLERWKDFLQKQRDENGLNGIKKMNGQVC